MDAYADSNTILIADVDCTTDPGKRLCTTHGVRGYPTVKWGDPANLEAYKGGRDFDSLKKFADENLKPLCSPFNLDICSDDQKKEIKKYEEMSAGDLDLFISGAKSQLASAEKAHEAEVQALQDAFAAVKQKESATIGLMQTVKVASTKKEAKAEL